MQQNCRDLSLDNLEKFWSQYAIGWSEDQPEPIYSYEKSLQIGVTYDGVIQEGDLLSNTSLVPKDTYLRSYNLISKWNDAEESHARFA